MEGYILQYKANSRKDMTLLNHKLFGRIAYKTYRGNKKGYYVMGMLNTTPFRRIIKGNIFVTSLENVDLESLREHGEVTVKKYEYNDKLLTAREYWENLAKDRGVLFVIRQRQNII